MRPALMREVSNVTDAAGKRAGARKWPWLRRVTGDRRALLALVIVNLFGTVYGFYWYRDQLALTPLTSWPFVPDSPTATLLFALFGLVFLLGRPGVERKPGPVLLQGFAYLANFKYGLWTPAIMIHLWLTTGQLDFESVHLSLSHLGMAIQALLYAFTHPPRAFPVALAGAWLFLNDYLDYGRGLHPFLPAPGSEAFAGMLAVTFSFVALFAGTYFSRYSLSRNSFFD